MNIPDGLHYTEDHEWILLENSNKTATVGITDFAQESLGDITYLELPNEGDIISAHQTFGVVESVKAVSDLYSPVTGKVLEVNTPLLDAPEQVNENPYTDAWMIRVEVKNPAEEEWLSPEEYKKHIEENT